VNSDDPSGLWSIGVTIPFGLSQTDAEDAVELLVPGSEAQVPMRAAPAPTGRIIDVYSHSASWLNEVKTGNQAFAPILQGNEQQADVDRSLIAAGTGTGYGRTAGSSFPVKGSTWWLFPNTSCVANYGSLPSYLESLGINSIQFECGEDADTSVYDSAFGAASQCDGNSIQNIAQLQQARTAANSADDAQSATEQGLEAAAGTLPGGAIFAGAAQRGLSGVPGVAQAGDAAAAAEAIGPAGEVAEVIADALGKAA